MNERIDHAAEARAWIAYSEDQNPEINAKAMHAAALAQVQATLALVEQQRIANLIAMAAQVWVEGDEGERREHLAWGGVGGYLTTEQKEALGL